MDYDQIGEFLEHQGLSDEEIDDYFLNEKGEDWLEHHGVKGQQWGVRRNRRANSLAEVGSGKGTTTQKLRALATMTPLDILRGRGLKTAARIRSTRQLARNERVKEGEASVKDKIAFYGGSRYQDIFPTGKPATNTHAMLGASIAGAIVVSMGTQVIKRALANA